MADYAKFNELNESMILLKSKVLSEVSAPKLSAMYARIIDGFVPYCQQSTSSLFSPHEAVAHYYEHVTEAKPYNRPKTEYSRMLARPILIIRDCVDGLRPSKKYLYNAREVPSIFLEDIHNYKDWLYESNCAKGTVRTRIGRIKQFLFYIHEVNDQGLTSLSPETFVAFIGGLTGKYSSIGKSNILYTVRNFFACPYISHQLSFDPTPFLTNLHTNKHERLRSCYTPDEIRNVLHAVDRSDAKGKMHYLMMLFAGLYGVDGQESGTKASFRNRIKWHFPINGRKHRASFLSVSATGNWPDVDYGHRKRPNVVKMTKKSKYVYF
jgi:hypothetical protein